MKIWGQVGINTYTPSAILDIVSQGNTSATKAFEAKNSDNQKLLEILDNGNVGINLEPSPPSSILHVKTDIKYENLPVLLPPYNPLGMNNLGTAAVNVVTKYLYYKRTTSFGNFALSNTNIPFLNGVDE